MKRKFLAAAVLGVMVSVTPAGAYAASTETSPLPVNSESDTVAQAEDNGFRVYEGTNKPKETVSVSEDGEILSCAYADDRVVLILRVRSGRRLQLRDCSGR